MLARPMVGAAVLTEGIAAPHVISPIEPLVYDVVGYQFQVGPMIAALCACLAVRFYVGQTEPTHRFTVDIPVSALTIMFTIGAIIRLQPEPFMALMYGTGIGAMGAGIIRIALSWVQRTGSMFTPPPGDDKK